MNIRSNETNREDRFRPLQKEDYQKLFEGKTEVERAKIIKEMSPSQKMKMIDVLTPVTEEEKQEAISKLDNIFREMVNRQ